MKLPEGRIALAHDHLFQYGGAEHVLRELIALYPSAPVYSLIAKRRNFPFLKGVDVRTSFLQRMPGGTTFFKWYLPYMHKAWESFDFGSYDLVISSSSGFVKGLRTTGKTKHICYCHTPARYLWPDSAEYLSSLHLPSPMRSYLLDLLGELREWDKRAATRVDHFVANSNFIASRIRKYYGRESTVIHPPIDMRQFAIAPRPGDFYLMVARLRPYKRVDIAIQAFNNLRLPLIIIGRGEEYRRLRSSAKRNITFLGDVSDAVRNTYLSRCKAFIHPQEEDFGISAVEAMASGRPVIAYRAGGALETVVPGVSGVFFDEQTWESLAYAVLRHEYDGYDPQKIREHAMQFDVTVFRERMQHFVAQFRPGI